MEKEQNSESKVFLEGVRLDDHKSIHGEREKFFRRLHGKSFTTEPSCKVKANFSFTPSSLTLDSQPLYNVGYDSVLNRIHFTFDPSGKEGVGAIEFNQTKDQFTATYQKSPKSKIVQLSGLQSKEAQKEIESEKQSYLKFSVSPLATQLGVNSLLDLDLLNVYVTQYNQQTGRSQVVDGAQIKAGDYFVDNMKKTLDSKWQNDFNLKPQYNNPQVEAVRNKYIDIYRLMAPQYCAEILSQAYADDPNQKFIIRKWAMCKVKNLYSEEQKSKEFGEMFNELYMISYKEQAPKIQNYLNDNPENWAEQLYNYYNDENAIQSFQNQMSDYNRNVNPMVVIKNVVTKLELLASDKSYASDLQKTLFGAVLQGQTNNVLTNCVTSDDVQNVLIELRDNGSSDFKDLVEKLIAEKGDISTAAKDIWKVYQEFPGRKAKGDEVANGVKQEISVLNKFSKLWPVISYGIALQSFISSMIDGKMDVVKGLEFGKATLQFVSDLAYKVLADSLAEFFLKKSQDASISSNLQKFSSTLSTWFSNGEPVEASIGLKIFGNTVKDFANRIGVVTAVIGFGISCYNLVKAIQSGDTTNIIFAALNAAISLASVIVTLGVVAGAAWAGPVGWAVAAVGAVVAIVQLLIALFSTPKPPPNPIDEFSKEVMSPKGYLYSSTGSYYALNGGLVKVSDVDFTSSPIGLPSSFNISGKGIIKNGSWIYVYSSSLGFKFPENSPQDAKSIMNSWSNITRTCTDCVLIGSSVFAIADNWPNRRVYTWNINEDNPSQWPSTLDMSLYMGHISMIVTDGTYLYAADEASIYRYDFRERTFKSWIQVVHSLRHEDLGLWDMVVGDNNKVIYTAMGKCLYQVEIATAEATRIYANESWTNASFIILTESDRELILVSAQRQKTSQGFVSRVARYKGKADISGFNSFDQNHIQFLHL